MRVRFRLKNGKMKMHSKINSILMQGLSGGGI